MTQEALKLALEALLHVYHEDEAHPKTLQAITAIKEALAQTERPVDCERCNRLEDALKRANGLAEHFERAWYLRGDEIERLTAQPEQEPVAYSGNGTAGQETDVRPTGFFFQMPKPQPEPVRITGFNCVCGRRMEVSAEQGVVPAPQRTWVELTEEQFDQCDAHDAWQSMWNVAAMLKELNHG